MEGRGGGKAQGVADPQKNIPQRDKQHKKYTKYLNNIPNDQKINQNLESRRGVRL
jgi:hypothetical protein